MQKSEQITKKFTKSWALKDLQILTDDGFVDVINLHRTIEYTKYIISTQDKTLECADKHILFNHNYEETFAEELQVGDKIITVDGVEEVISVINTNEKEEMYDFELCQESKHRYYTNGFLSHNTYMLRMLANYLNIPFYIQDSTSLSESGYVGDDVENAILGAFRASGGNLLATHYAIIVFDEFDKLSRKSENASITRDVGGEGVQQSLLKLVEGAIVNVPPNGGRKHPEQECIQIDTSNILFFGIGAFDGIEGIIEKRLNRKTKIGFNTFNNVQTQEDKDEDLLSQVTTEDLKRYGFIPELIGRFPLITHVKPLTEEQLYKILIEPKNSIVKQYQKLFWIDNVDLSFEDDALRLIASEAAKKKTGARSLRGVLDKTLAELMFDYGGYHKKKTKLKVTKDMVEKHVETVFEEKKIA